MRRLVAPALALGLALSAVAATPSQQRADTDHQVDLEIGASVTVDGGVPAGINPGPTTSDQTGKVCTKNPHEYCETILVHLSNPYEEENAKKGRERANAIFSLTTTDGLVSDYDVYVHLSDAEGNKYEEIANAGEFPLLAGSSDETVTVVATTTADEQELWLYVEVYYFSAIAPYTMDIDFS